MPTKLFTPQEANRRLPLVKKIVTDILSRGQKIRALELMSPTPLVQEEIKTLSIEIETLMGELEALGCYFKDWNFEIGLVDFPAVINGKEVLLCWRSDEPLVRWYHGFEDGYAGRRHIPEDLL